jgi:alkylation response protein AidB-like acyl-CoA dehydrogenase
MRVDVELTPAQIDFRDQVIAFTKAHITPEYVEECDEEGIPPLDLLPKLAAEGWLGLGLPPEHGGWGGTTEIVILLEHLEYAFIQLGSLVSRGAMYPANVLAHFGTARDVPSSPSANRPPALTCRACRRRLLPNRAAAGG